MNRNKKIALARHLAIKVSDLYKEHEDYLVLTDSEADDMAADYIKDTVWAFNSAFLSAHTKQGIDSDVIEAIQSNGKCESNNAAILSLIDDVEHFVDDAIRCDGRGHFLSSYDGEEHEVRVGKSTYYIYRTN